MRGRTKGIPSAKQMGRASGATKSSFRQFSKLSGTGSSGAGGG